MGDPKRPQDALLRHYDAGLRRFGDTARGALWPNEEDNQRRFDVMLDVIERDGDEPVTLCDLGCGTGNLLARMTQRGFRNVAYIGVDRSPLALSHARAKFPEATFLELDVADPAADLAPLACDYLVANGLFTGKFEMTHDEMMAFWATTVRRLWPLVRRGLAFNAMSTVVQWNRDDLFHLSMDDAARLLHELAGRNVRIRADYGLYEFTAYARKQRPVADAATQRVPVMRPLLPTTKQLLAYLPRIDKTRVYSNHGPLAQELQQRLGELLAVPPGSFVTAASGTAALAGAILATAGRPRERRLAALPAYTFAATAVAVEECGYTPYLVDVEPDTWALDPQRLRAHPRLGEFGLVVPVAPYGRPVAQDPWHVFHRDTDIPVVIDGAASFDLIAGASAGAIGALPVALSFHATKSFGCGEGGGVVTTDSVLATRTVRALNFGFEATRESRAPSINGKMSEYHAAVGLAELDGWAEKIAALHRVAATYRTTFASAGIGGRCIAAPDISATYVLCDCATASLAQQAQRALAQAGIEFRYWYGDGLQAHAQFADDPRDELPVTQRLGATLLGLPVAADLADETIERVAIALQTALGSR